MHGSSSRQYTNRLNATVRNSFHHDSTAVFIATVQRMLRRACIVITTRHRIDNEPDSAARQIQQSRRIVPVHDSTAVFIATVQRMLRRACIVITTRHRTNNVPDSGTSDSAEPAELCLCIPKVRTSDRKKHVWHSP